MDNLDKPINKELLLDILGTITKLRKDFPYTMLLYVLDPKDAMKVLDIFEGTTITFPSKQELLDCVTFSIIQKYESFDDVPKEVLNGFTKQKYSKFLAAINGTGKYEYKKEDDSQ